MSYSKSVELYGDGIGKVEYVSHMGSDLTVVNSARVSFGVEKEQLDDKDKKLINYLIKHRHTSTLEHNLVTFRFCVPLYIRSQHHVPLYIRSQHHRHRTWSYNEISRRYTDVDLRFYEPKAFRTQHKSNRQASNAEDLINPIMNSEDESHPKFGEWVHPITAAEFVAAHNADSLVLFEQLIEAGVCREQARGVLPQNLYTEYYGTVNANNLFKFISLRMHEGAQWEIQKVAEACLEIAYDLYPITTTAFIENHNNELMKKFIEKQ
jgi:thymidylate synthase (FAD)